MKENFNTLRQRATQIKNEVEDGANTSARVGSFCEDVVDTMTGTITEYNVSVQHPTSGIDGSNKYSLESAIAQVPQELRKMGLKVTFVNSTGQVETWEFGGEVFSNINSWIQQVQRMELSELKDDTRKRISNITGTASYTVIPLNVNQNLDTLSDIINLSAGDILELNVELSATLTIDLYMRIKIDGGELINIGVLSKGTSFFSYSYNALKDCDVQFFAQRYSKADTIITTNLVFPTKLTRYLKLLEERTEGLSEKNNPLAGSDTVYTNIKSDGSLTNNVNWTKVSSFPVEKGKTYHYYSPADAGIGPGSAIAVLYKDDLPVKVVRVADKSSTYDEYVSIEEDANLLYVLYAPGYQNKYAPTCSEVVRYSLYRRFDAVEKGLTRIATATKSDWDGRTIGFYGDSITEFYAKGDTANAVAPFSTETIYSWGVDWCTRTGIYFNFSQIRVRGIGGQRFAWQETGGWTCYINDETGLQKSATYKSWPDGVEDCPEGHTAVRGCACAWSRITNQFPASIKDTVDVVLIMFHNDTANADEINDTKLEFINGDRTDEEWASSSYYAKYNGDYNIKTLRGGIASTIMKFQVWMPNAILVLCTPMSTNVESSIGNGTTVELDTKKNYHLAQTVKEMAGRLSIPLIDVFATDGINSLNRTPFVGDSIHPGTVLGQQRLAMTIIGGLKNILPYPAF